jgi:hypothetical protein
VAVLNGVAGTIEGLEVYADQATAAWRKRMYDLEAYSRGLSSSGSSQSYGGASAPSAPAVGSWPAPTHVVYTHIKTYNSGGTLIMDEDFTGNEALLMQRDRMLRSYRWQPANNYTFYHTLVTAGGTVYTVSLGECYSS